MDEGRFCGSVYAPRKQLLGLVDGDDKPGLKLPILTAVAGCTGQRPAEWIERPGRRLDKKPDQIWRARFSRQFGQRLQQPVDQSFDWPSRLARPDDAPAPFVDAGHGAGFYECREESGPQQ